MQIFEVDAKQYQANIPHPFSVFDSVKFNEAHQSKCEALKYFLFRTSKLKFGLVGGIIDKTFKCPFSAPFGILSPIKKDIRLQDYHDAVAALVDYFHNKVSAIQLTLPPLIYDETHISQTINSLIAHGFSIDYVDLNYQMRLENFQNYVENLVHKARQRLNNTLKLERLSFQPCLTQKDFEIAHHVLHENRRQKNRPLHLSLKDLLTLKESGAVQMDFFMVKDGENCVAAAVCYHVTPEIVQVVYWGDLPGHEALGSINYLAYYLFDTYHHQGKKIVDIGPSTKAGVPNFGLCEFKRSIGCEVSPKLTLTKNL